MGNTAIKHYLPKAELLTYNELSKVKTIEKLLPRHKSYCMLLYPVKSDTDGHWVCITRYDKTLEYLTVTDYNQTSPLIGAYLVKLHII